MESNHQSQTHPATPPASSSQPPPILNPKPALVNELYRLGDTRIALGEVKSVRHQNAAENSTPYLIICLGLFFLTTGASARHPGLMAWGWGIAFYGYYVKRKHEPKSVIIFKLSSGSEIKVKIPRTERDGALEEIARRRRA